MNVRIPTPLRSYTDGASVVVAHGMTVSDVLDDLDAQFPGMRFRVVNEQGVLRKHMRVFINSTDTRDLTSVVTEADEVTLMQALSGG